MGVKAGLDPKVLIDIINAGVAATAPGRTSFHAPS
jgi:hypothetical protein